ncbi:peroxidase-like [Venturia canescens]|uniref:peroxidase-like n=1 Tax=Venturia canescens TaxID=32260 RepID=UPI001C9CB667|nr:peroxidase-like [Venturia canescens]
MRVGHLLFSVALLLTLVCRFSIGQNDESEVYGNGGRIEIELDGPEVQIQRPPRKENILTIPNRRSRNCENTGEANLDEISTNDGTDEVESSLETEANEARKEGARSSDYRMQIFEKSRTSLPSDRNEVEDRSSLQKSARSKREIFFKDISVDPGFSFTTKESGSKFDFNLSVNASSRTKTCQDSLDCENRDMIEKQRPVRQTNRTSALQKFVETHVNQGRELAKNFQDRARALVARGLCPRMHTPSMLNYIHSKSGNDVVTLNEQSESALFGTKLLQQTLAQDYNMTADGYVHFLRERDFRVVDENVCRPAVYLACNPSAKYRNIDGSCNNIARPFWGRTNSALGRVLPARYSDGIHGMPTSVTGAELPNPRELSVRLITRGEKHDPELSLVVMQWGQVVAHDLARQVPDQTAEGGIECCADGGRAVLDKSLQHHSCAPIEISPHDPFYSRFAQRCMNFVRSMTAPSETCTLQPARQLNAVTSFLDCSQMYGVSDSESKTLRAFFGGRLKAEYRRGRWWLPTSRNQSDVCDVWTPNDFCYVSGDPRTNQNPQLVVLHTLLVREHNRVAMTLWALNPHWNDEKNFQEARRIVIAEYQHITYNEWLPLLFGEANSHSSKRVKRTMSNEYNENVDPSTVIGFTTGVYRSLHSMVAGNLGVCDLDRNIVDVLRLENYYFRPSVIENNDNFAGLLRGLVAQYVGMQDTVVTEQVTEFALRSRNPFGMDLTSIDIQRGRDHGMPGYNAYRRFCNLRPARTFSDLDGEISPENIERLRREYAHVDDIDLVVGAYMENLVPGSRLGPTNFCLFREQFYRTRAGDRYFYDNANFSHSFTPEQFEEITKVTLARLVCDTENGVGHIQPEAFRAISWNNPLVPCRTLPKLDLTLWKE